MCRLASALRCRVQTHARGRSNSHDGRQNSSPGLDRCQMDGKERQRGGGGSKPRCVERCAVISLVFNLRRSAARSSVPLRLSGVGAGVRAQGRVGPPMLDTASYFFRLCLFRGATYSYRIRIQLEAFSLQLQVCGEPRAGHGGTARHQRSEHNQKRERKRERG
jgi:hypothetical protein